MEKKYPIKFDPQEAWDEFSEYVDDNSDSFSCYAGRSVMLFDSFVLAVKKMQPPTGPKWVKASECLPISTKPEPIIVKWRTVGGNHMLRYMTANQLVDLVKGEVVLEYEWLDESAAATHPLTPGAPTETGTYFAVAKHHIYESMEYVVLHYLKHKNEYHVVGFKLDRVVKPEDIVGYIKKVE